jgi:hypothetical protein
MDSAPTSPQGARLPAGDRWSIMIAMGADATSDAARLIAEYLSRTFPAKKN